MAVKKIRCGKCGQTGGRFILRGDEYFHASRCTAPVKVHTKSTFPFTTQHLTSPNDGPITIDSMRDLRRIENACGVASEVYNNDQSYQGEKY